MMNMIKAALFLVFAIGLFVVTEPYMIVKANESVYTVDKVKGNVYHAVSGDKVKRMNDGTIEMARDKKESVYTFEVVDATHYGIKLEEDEVLARNVNDKKDIQVLNGYNNGDWLSKGDIVKVTFVGDDTVKSIEKIGHKGESM